VRINYLQFLLPDCAQSGKTGGMEDFFTKTRRAGCMIRGLCRHFCMQNRLKYASYGRKLWFFIGKNCYNSVLPATYINITTYYYNIFQYKNGNVPTSLKIYKKNLSIFYFYGIIIK
jgi:hypothetical protein